MNREINMSNKITHFKKVLASLALALKLLDFLNQVPYFIAWQPNCHGIIRLCTKKKASLPLIR
jgi:hypothetical protein